MESEKGVLFSSINPGVFMRSLRLSIAFALLLVSVCFAEPVASNPELEKKDSKTMGVLGPVTFGPVLTFPGFPTPLRFGLDVKYTDIFQISFDYGLFPKLTVSNVSVKFNSWRLGAKVFPFRGAMYVGLSFGKQSFDGTMSNTVQNQAVNYALHVDSTILVPHIGWKWNWESGLFMGMELGVQLATKSTSAFDSNADNSIKSADEYTSAQADVEAKGNTFGKQALPHFALFQIGWMF